MADGGLEVRGAIARLLAAAAKDCVSLLKRHV